MPAITYGLSSYERAEGNMPPLRVVNMYTEQASSEGPTLQSRAGLDDRAASMGAGPVKAVFRRDGVLSGALFGVSAGNIYNATTSLGSLAGAGPVSIAGNEMGVMVTAGSTMRYWDGATLANIAFPDSASVTKVITGASRFIALRASTGKFYWTDSLGVTFDALDFATAESAPDGLRDALFIDDALMLFGAETVEFWPNTSDAVLPFAPLEGRVIERGIRATGCATAFGPTFAWVTNRNEVCVQDESNIISNVGLQARISASTDVSLFTFFIDGVEFLALRLDTETQVYSRSTGAWSEFATYGQTNWAARCHADGVFGSGIDGKTLAWGTDKTDVSATSGIMERLFTAGYPLNSGGLSIDNLQLRCNPGETPYLTGDYDDPVVEMRMSRDAGRTWGTWRSASLGAQGEYSKRVFWRALGQANRPGFLCEFRVTDPVPFRVSGALINEEWGAR